MSEGLTVGYRVRQRVAMVRKLLEKRVPSLKESCPYDEACGGSVSPGSDAVCSG